MFFVDAIPVKGFSQYGADGMAFYMHSDKICNCSLLGGVCMQHMLCGLQGNTALMLVKRSYDLPGAYDVTVNCLLQHGASTYGFVRDEQRQHT